jgi:hypothetical protein
MSPEYHFERLEDRVLLAVNVLQNGGTLSIVGDNDGDDVRLQGTNVIGEVAVFVDDDFVGFFDGVRHIRARFGSGDNELSLDGVQIGGNLTANMGGGDDEVDVDNFIVGGEGAFSSFFGRNVTLNLGGQSGDFVEFDTDGDVDDDITIGRHLTIRGAADVELDGEGGESSLQSFDINIGGRLVIQSYVASDINDDGFTLRVDDCNIGGAVRVNLGNGEDLVDVSDSSFGGRVDINLGGGDDTLDSDSDGDFSVFARKVNANGGTGFDTLITGFDNVFAVGPTFTNFEEVL